MKKIKSAAAQIGLGLGACYAFFLIPSIEGLFKDTFVLLIRQIIAIGFAACLLINPKALIDLGQTYAPKLVLILQMLFYPNKNEK